MLRTGTRALVAGTELTGTVTATGADETHEYLELVLGLGGDAASLDFDRTHVELGGAVPGDIAVVATGMGGSESRVLVRRKLGGGDEVTGALFGERWDEGKRVWVRAPFKAGEKKAATADKELKQRWVEAFAAQYGDSWRMQHAWFQFASGRVRRLPRGARESRGRDRLASREIQPHPRSKRPHASPRRLRHAPSRTVERFAMNEWLPARSESEARSRSMEVAHRAAARGEHVTTAS